MRKIEWVPGTSTAVKERASALAWASHRRGKREWVGKNVTQLITDYLVEHGYQIDRGRTIHIMKRLVDEDYAYIRYGEGMKRVVEWGFMPDVELIGHTPPIKAKVLDKPEAHVVTEEAHPEKAKVYTGPATMPPLPAAPEPPVYRLDELNKLLKAWHEKDPDTYATWVDAAVDSLHTNT